MGTNLVEIKNLIYIVRSQKVMLDSDLARLYEVETRVLNQAVKRNIERFPLRYMFQLNAAEYEDLKVRSQIVMSPKGGGRQHFPYVFTEQGVAMLSSVLKSKKAIQINMQIMDAFVLMRRLTVEHKDLQEQINELKHYFLQYAKDNNDEIDRINEAINLLLDRTKPVQIGFKTE